MKKGIKSFLITCTIFIIFTIIGSIAFYIEESRIWLIIVVLFVGLWAIVYGDLCD